MAAEALGEIGEPSALPILCDALQDPIPEVRLCAIQALGERGFAEALPPLEIIKNSDTAVVPPFGRLADEAKAVIARLERRMHRSS